VPRTLRLTLAYDGTDFHGWQRQAGVRTVQEEVEAVLRRVLREPVNLTGASRTDAGVHARGQVAHLCTDASIPADNLRRAVSHRLPGDVTVLHVAEAPLGFDARRDARAKLYRYRVYNHPRRPVAHLRQRYAWHVWYPLDLDRMRAAAARLVGTYDFTAFASAGSPRRSGVRTMYSVGIRRCYDEVLIDVRGDGFLYNQVRNMVGTLVEIGRGHWEPERVSLILESRDRTQAGPTAPAHGLCLQWVEYDPRAGDRHGP